MFACGSDGYKAVYSLAEVNPSVQDSTVIVADTENWDNSVGLNNPGQSGDVNDAHYRDLYQLWAHGKYFPIFYSRAKVESVAEKVFELKPAPPAPAPARATH